MEKYPATLDKRGNCCHISAVTRVNTLWRPVQIFVFKITTL